MSLEQFRASVRYQQTNQDQVIQQLANQVDKLEFFIKHLLIANADNEKLLVEWKD